ATLPEHPESVPVNALVAVKGTPLEGMKRVAVFDMVRMIATVRLVMPKTKIRLSAGRLDMPVAEQALCFLAGANSIFAGDKLLTTPNPDFNSDKEMFEILGLSPSVMEKAIEKDDNIVSRPVLIESE
ncbi:MAG TPA: biotin synthase, partial [Chitinophagales bacterium]|nr:biotin synthase [Chitinophagales bacterium]